MHEDSPLLEAIYLFAKVTGVAVPKSEDERYGKTLMMRLDGGVSEYTVTQWYDAIKEALELDPSEVTANLMLNYYTKAALKDAKFSMMQLLDDPTKYLEKLEAPRRLFEIVNRKEIADERRKFIKNLRAALQTYDAADRDDIKEALKEHDRIAFLRRDALRGVERLRVDQFLRGEPEAAGVKPVFHTKVFQWWNINSLLQAALTMPSGVSLNLIRDRDEYQSYFVFCIRNGGNLYVLTDVPEYAHPLQGMMTRRPDRRLGERAARAWFPYDLLGLKWDEEAERYYIERSEEKGIAIYQQEHKHLAMIKDLTDPNEVIWITMMLDLIVKKFWDKGFQKPELSYTGEMIKVEDRLIAGARGVNLPVVADYQPLNLKPLTLEDVCHAPEEQVGEKAHEPNKWLEERYKDRIKPEMFNVVEQVGTVVLLPGHKIKPQWKDDPKLKHVPLEGGLSKVTASEIARLGHFARQDVQNHDGRLEVMDSTRFGTRDELEADRLFIARYNMANQIEELASAEFAKRKDEIIKWFTEAARKNLPTLLSWCAEQDEIWLDEGAHSTFTHTEAGGKKRSVDVKGGTYRNDKHYYRTFLQRIDIAEEKKRDMVYHTRLGAINLGDYKYPSKWICAVTQAQASYKFFLNPSNPEQLAQIAGCKVEELPDVLQHWDLQDKYIGNSILERIDPMNWRVKNPWMKLPMQVIIPLSKRGLAQIKKEKGSAPVLSNITKITQKEDWRSVSVEEQEEDHDDA